YFDVQNMLVRVPRTMSSHSWVDSSVTGLKLTLTSAVGAALLMRVVIGPYASTVAATASWTLASSATSSGTNMASPPASRIRWTFFSPLSTERPLRTTLAPSSANTSAMVRPMPRVEPVTSATLPSSLMRRILADVRRGAPTRAGYPMPGAPDPRVPVTWRGLKGEPMELQDARVLVVGASSGIGRAVARQTAAGGAHVVLAARRADKLAEAAAEAGKGASTAVCDVRQPAQCERVVRDAVRQLGGLDVVVYATAVDPLVRLIDTDAERWRLVYETNVFGASLVTRAALAPLTESGGRMIFISASSVGRPLPGMGAYETSKAALDELVRAWRGEHPEIAFCNVAVGNTLGTEVYQSW